MEKTQRVRDDIRVINFYTGYVVLITALLMLLPMLVSVFYTEWEVVIDFAISMNIALVIALLFMISGKNNVSKFKVEWKHGLIIASFSWIILTLLAAIPYVLSGHVGSYLDACFDVMSGFTTTGLILTQDLDHLSLGLNMWRHILTFIGGQGMVVLALSFLSHNTLGAYKMYVGEGKDVELVPNVKGTAKIIWIISLIYLAVGTIALWIDGMFIGLKVDTSFFHGLFIFMSAWSTGGFAPMSQNMLYYHSFSYEIITIIFFIVGSFNFGLHYAIWIGKKNEIVKNIETQSFFITATLTTFLLMIGLSKLKVYPDSIALFRKGVYNLLSAHTTTGFANIYARQFALEWGDFAIVVMTLAMMFGGSACSTAGGFKGLRTGIVFKGLIADIKRQLLPEHRVKIFKYHHLKESILDDSVVKSSAIIIICYIALMAGGALIGSYYGYPIVQSAFESASATGNVGLSLGITAPTMPAVMKVYYIVAMYLGRLEFISIFVLMAFFIGGIKKTCKKYLERC